MISQRWLLLEQITNLVSLITRTATRMNMMQQLQVTYEFVKMKVRFLFFNLHNVLLDYLMSKEQLAGHSGTLNILSKIGGWMTVTPRRMSRREPIDKE